MAIRHSNPVKQVNLATTSGTVPVLVTSTAVVIDRPARAEITIVNTSANIVDLQFATTEANDANGVLQPVAPTAVAGQGLRLAAGASWTSGAYTGPIAAIAQTATSNLTVAEF